MGRAPKEQRHGAPNKTNNKNNMNNMNNKCNKNTHLHALGVAV